MLHLTFLFKTLAVISLLIDFYGIINSFYEAMVQNACDLILLKAIYGIYHFDDLHKTARSKWSRWRPR